MMGKFARPKRKKGSGFGIAYSTEDKSKHKAAKKDVWPIKKRVPQKQYSFNSV